MLLFFGKYSTRFRLAEELLFIIREKQLESLQTQSVIMSVWYFLNSLPFLLAEIYNFKVVGKYLANKSS